MTAKRRLCPRCGHRLVSGYPHGRAYTSTDGRRLVLVVWRHRAEVHRTPPADCTATMAEAEAKDRANLVRWE